MERPSSGSTSPGVNFTNILRAAFTHADPKRPKKDSQFKQLFALLGSAGVKAALKHVDESDPRALGSIFQQSIGAKSPMGQASSTWHVLFSQKFALKFHYIIECYFCKIVPFFVLMLGTKKSSKKCQKLLIKFG